MNLRTAKAIVAGAATLVFMVATACTDTSVEPKSSISDSNVFNDPNSYQAFLAKLYAGLAVTGQQGPNGNADINGIDEGFSNYVRLYWESQELPTDEAVIAWNDVGLPELNKDIWTPGNGFISALYYRVYFQVQLINEFLRQTTDAKLADRGQSNIAPTIHTYRAEARFLRALSYWHGLDAFGGTIPLVTDAQPLSATPPAASSGTQVYDFIVSELTAIIPDLPAANASNYGRANQYAAQMVLANMYLNAAVYTGTPHYDLALAAAQAVIAGPYALDTIITVNVAGAGSFQSLRVFLADNNQSKEMIFPITSDGIHTETWGGTTFLIHAACGGSMNNNLYGVNGCWWGLRLKQQTYNLFAAGDRRRANFYTSGQTASVGNISDFTQGIAAPKYFNVDSAGAAGSNSTHPDTDFPMFRLAEAYLIYAEANAMGGGGSAATALGYINNLRTRAGMAVLAAAPIDTIRAERGRELYWEGHRRTDLVRWGLFTGSTYNWEWKGGTQAGGTLDPHLNLYPIPANELIANPNLTQNPGY